MAKTHPPYAPEFRRQMVELVRSGRSAGERDDAQQRNAEPEVRQPGTEPKPYREAQPIARSTAEAGERPVSVAALTSLRARSYQSAQRT